MGFDGKTLIHPGQVEPVQRGLRSRVPTRWSAPGPSSRRSRPPRREGRGVATLDGRLIENLHVDTAQKVLATAEAIAALS